MFVANYSYKQNTTTEKLAVLQTSIELMRTFFIEFFKHIEKFYRGGSPKKTSSRLCSQFCEF